MLARLPEQIRQLLLGNWTAVAVVIFKANAVSGSMPGEMDHMGLVVSKALFEVLESGRPLNQQLTIPDFAVIAHFVSQQSVLSFERQLVCA
jgi:hypothetical protein